MDTGIVWFTLICGNASITDAFWNPDVTINTDNPDFTECFQDTALVWGACGLLWLAALIYLPVLLTRSDIHQINCISRLNLAKLICNCLTISILAAQFCLIRFDVRLYVPAKLLALFLYVGTMILASYISRKEYLKGEHSSGLMFCFWLLLLLVNCIKLRTTVLVLLNNKDIVYGIHQMSFFIFFTFILSGFILQLFSDKEALVAAGYCKGGHHVVYKKECPEIKATFLERLLFTWCFSTLLLAYKGKLTSEELLAVPEATSAQSNVNCIYKSWTKSCKGYGPESRETNENTTNSTWHMNSSLLVTLIRSYGLHFLSGSILEIIKIILIYIRPILLSCLLESVSTRTAFVWKGYFFAAALLVVSILKSLFDQQFVYSRNSLYHQIRTGLYAAIYRKCLLISNSARKYYPSGKISNLMTIDVSKVCDGQVALQDLWSTPVQTAVSVWLLYKYIGSSSLAGLTLLLVLITSNFFLISHAKRMNMSVMKLKDARMKMLSEVLNGIKIVKLHAWEKAFQDKVSAIRNKEVNMMKKASFYFTCSTVAFSCAPIFFMVLTFTCYLYTTANATLSAQVAFVTLTLVNSLASSLGLFPSGIATVLQASTCLHRIEKFLRQREVDEYITENHTKGWDSVSVRGGTFSWDDQGLGVLKDVNISIEHGSLTAVVGQVGCGKSSLLAALLGELHKDSGEVHRIGTIAYVSQEAWLRNQTLRDNILFGKALDEKKYRGAVEACALGYDLKVLPDGDMTLIGEKGVTLSGGQKQRVALARAVYHDADIYLMDDPLSAVDSHVGKHIFDHIIGPSGLLKNKTRVLVTHGIAHLPKMDRIIVLNYGRISEYGTYNDLIKHGGPFAEFMRKNLNNHGDKDEMNVDTHEELACTVVDKNLAITSPTLNIANNQVRQRKSNKSSSSIARGNVNEDQKQDERLSTANKTMPASRKYDHSKPKDTNSTPEKVKWSVFLAYIKNMGGYGILYLSSFILVTCLEFAGDIWLSRWSQVVKNEMDQTDQNWVQRQIVVYAVLGMTTGLVTVLSSVCLTIACHRASTIIHRKVLVRIIKAPMRFFDTTPIGKILHCFGEDMSAVDNHIAGAIPPMLKGSSAVITTIAAISMTEPLFVIAVVPLGIIYYFLQRFYISTSNQLRRISSTASSPMYSHFTETITGVMSVRAFQQQQQFIEESNRRIDEYKKVRCAIMVTNRWFSLWLMIWSSFIVFLAAMLAVWKRSPVGAGLAALSISYALKIADSLAMFVRTSADLENNVISLEKIQELSFVEQEKSWHVDDITQSKEWPVSGKIVFHDFSTRYQPGLDMVLKNIQCVVAGGEKVGIVGRTGAGKSSMTLSLFRIIEAAEGDIAIDDVIISKIGLHDLRTKLTIIPQDPVIFSGSLRFNLDPVREETDENIYKALEMVHLKSFVLALPNGLEYNCAESGSNLSLGQRQLVCLARALLRKTKVLILDEVTAAVDLETDELIQNTIRTQFKDCTVITIAHRISTVLDCDRIMVMKNGRIIEFDKPLNLMENKKSEFFSMCREAKIA